MKIYILCCDNLPQNADLLLNFGWDVAEASLNFPTTSTFLLLIKIPLPSAQTKTKSAFADREQIAALPLLHQWPFPLQFRTAHIIYLIIHHHHFTKPIIYAR